MNNVPETMDGARVLRVADLTAAASTERTRHIVGGEEVHDFAGLAIASYATDPGFYLFYCDESWRVITDTWHDSMEAAIAQAEFEFGPLHFVAPDR